MWHFQESFKKFISEHENTQKKYLITDIHTVNFLRLLRCISDSISLCRKKYNCQAGCEIEHQIVSKKIL